MFPLLIFILLLLIVNYAITKKIFSPGFTFNGIYFVTLLLYSFMLSDIQQELSNMTLLIYWLSLIFFNIPVILLSLKQKYNVGIFSRPKHRPIRKFKYRVPSESMLIALVIAFFLVQVIYSKGFPVLWKLTGSDKTYFDFGIPSITGLYYGFIITVGAWSLFKKRSILRFVCLFIAILIISRQVIISIFLEGILFKLLTLKKNKWKFYRVILVLAVVGIFAFALIGNFRTGEADFLRVAKFKDSTNSIPTAFKWIYSYMCFSVSNFNNLVSMTSGNVNHGASMINELTPTVLTNMLNIKEVFTDNFLVSLNFTVSTYMPPIYLDFGVFGICLFTFILGLVSILLFNALQKNKSLRLYLAYCVLTHNILLLFFNNMFLYLPILSQFIFIPLIFVRKRKRIYRFKENYSLQTIKAIGE